MFKGPTARSRFWLSTMGALALALCMPPGARATDWYVDDDADPDGDGRSWSEAFTHLQDALWDAQSGDVIHVAGGVYRPDRDAANPGGTGSRDATFQLVPGVKMYGGYRGLAAGGDQDDVDIWLFESILSGDLLNNDVQADEGTHEDNSYHVVSGGSQITQDDILDGFTITAGNALHSNDDCDNGGPGRGSGAGLYNVEGSPTVSNCRFAGNRARCHGAGMANFDLGGLRSKPTVYNCVFQDNWAGSIEYTGTSGGGAIYNGDEDPGDGNYSGSDPIIENCLFINNRAGHDLALRDGHHGGALRNDSSDPLVVNCVFIENNACHGYGGAVANLAGASPTLINCTIADNSTCDAYGAGGIDSQSVYEHPSVATLSNCILWGNSRGSGITDEFAQLYYNDANNPSPVYFSCIEECN